MSAWMSSNRKSLSFVVVSCALLAVIVKPSHWVATELGWKVESADGFFAIIWFFVGVRFMRRKDKIYAREWKYTQPSLVVVSALILLLLGGNAGIYTAPLAALALTVSGWSKWLVVPKVDSPQPRPNPIKFFFKRIPTAVALTLVGFTPPYLVVIPGVLLADNPVGYSAWCGVGYPFLSMLIRKTITSYFIHHTLSQVKAGRIEAKNVVPYLAVTTFAIGFSIMSGNVMLLYISESVKYAALNSILAILTECLGKLYTVFMIVKTAKLKQRMIKNMQSKMTISSIKRAVSINFDKSPLGKNNRVAPGTDSGSAESFTESEKEAGSPDSPHISAMEKMKTAASRTKGVNAFEAVHEKVKSKRDMEEQEHLEDELTLFAVRLVNEMVAEKVCIVVGALTTTFLEDFPHDSATVIQFMAIFMCAEILADAILVFILVKYFDVPILRLPREDWKWLSPEFWTSMFETATLTVSGIFYFIHAYGSARVWFTATEATAPNGLDGLVNATNVTLPGF